MPVHEVEKRRVVCEKCGEILLLETEDGDFYHPQSCEHYEVYECEAPLCDDPDVYVFPQKHFSDFAWCIKPRKK